jgi:hypothetical protein
MRVAIVKREHVEIKQYFIVVISSNDQLLIVISIRLLKQYGI